ncbi:hypothetical protein [Thalassospira marina]|uniref:Flagellar hook-length control protein-like C-terminal domain-containing protein n=1 Tax=Thalassospira marina TaxID=2048283 RepID=A0ABM6Q648_9PROT|nr:hypothetical protein [Thalassospira marina]AUG51978.1 hypothetical protein CSC3H3_04030 [Thalassospira marina]
MAASSPTVPSVSGANAVGAGNAGSGNGAATAIVQNPPAALTKLPVDSLLQATLQAKNGAEVTLQTSAGNVTVKLPQPLPGNLNDLVWVRIMPQSGADGSNGLRLQVLPQMLPGGGSAGGAAAGSAAAATNANPASILPGQSFTGMTTSTLSFPGGSTLPAGSQVQMMFVGPGAASPAKAAGLMAAGQGLGMAGATSQGGLTSSGNLPATILAQQGATAGGAAGAAGTNTGLLAAGGAKPAAPMILTGTVLPPGSPEARMLPDGFTALRTNAGIVGVRLPVPAPVGATLSFAIDANNLAAARLPQPVMTEGELMARGQAASLSQDWDSLQRAISTLAQSDPQAAQALLNQIPAAGPRLTTTMMFFFTAIVGAGGSAKSWLGDRTIGALDKSDGKDSGLGKKLDKDFNTLRGMASEPRSDGWRVMSMPFQMGDRIEQMQFSWRQTQSDEDESRDQKPNDPGTRFLLDLSFTRLGHTQLDGLVRKETQKFDLIVRTENTLDGPQRDDIRAIFNQALAISKLGGSLNFQNGNRFIEVSREPATPGPQKRGLEA